METVGTTVVMIQTLFWGFIVTALIYLIIKRVGDKEKEDFEKRDN